VSAPENAHARWVEDALRRYEAPLLHYAARLVGDADAARDVVQDAFLRLCEQRRSDLEGRLAPWLYKVCRNRAMDLRRRGRIVPKASSSAVEETAGTGASPEQAIAERDAAANAVAALDALPEAQQEVLRLRLRHGLAYRDIAEVTGLTVSHVGVLIHEGLSTLRRRLGALASVSNEGGAR
jgi:RNA polymerase sigma-70 factor (ECF subfamily)